LKGIGNGVVEPAVRVFVMGANRWRSAETWPMPGTDPDTLYLQAPGDSAAAGGLLPALPGPRNSASAFHSDPAEPLSDPFNGDYGPHDYRALPGQDGLLVFETAPFTAPYEMIGPVTAELAVSASVPDFDLWLQLYDVAPDGTAWNLASPGTALLRASYRDGGPERRLVPEGEVVRLRLEGPLTANRFLRGHRLRVVLSGAFFPLFSINPQTGRQEFESDAIQPGRIRIHHARDQASWIVLPEVPAGGE
ncbi:MAG: CocE/NonD family hydrolase, partial [Gemmatimonadales bacterium]